MNNFSNDSFDAVVIGAGFFGLSVADFLSNSGRKVLVIESESSPMKRASYVNQARIHVGYHYPRSILTASRSQISSEIFMRKYSEAVFDSFEHIYAVGRIAGRTSATQFERFCKSIGAPLSETSKLQRNRFSSHLIEKTWIAQEFAFDTEKLRSLVLGSIAEKGGVTFWFDTQADSITKTKDGVSVSTNRRQVIAPLVISCIYAEVNNLHRRSDIPTLPIQFEIAEMALVRVPKEWEKTAVTVMDGPFFSMMPFPAESLFSLSHVRYTPQLRWVETNESISTNFSRENLSNFPSSFKEMKADLVRYIPDLKSLEYVKSIREIKAVLSQNDLSDSRPTLVRSDFGIPGYYAILGGKIDNIDDALVELKIQIDALTSGGNDGIN